METREAQRDLLKLSRRLGTQCQLTSGTEEGASPSNTHSRPLHTKQAGSVDVFLL